MTLGEPTGLQNSWTVMGCMGVYLIEMGLAAPHARAAAMHAVAGSLGAGASMPSVIVNAAGAIASGLAAHQPDHSPSGLILGAALTNVGLFRWYARRGKNFTG